VPWAEEDPISPASVDNLYVVSATPGTPVCRRAVGLCSLDSIESFVGSRSRRQNGRIADAAGALARARSGVTVHHAGREGLGLG